MAAEQLENSISGPVLRSVELGERLYILFSYHYYVNDRPLVPDESFDSLSKYLLNFSEELRILSIDTLKAGTYLDEYPEWASNDLTPYDRSKYKNWWEYDEYLHEQVDSVFI